MSPAACTAIFLAMRIAGMGNGPARARLEALLGELLVAFPEAAAEVDAWAEDEIDPDGQFPSDQEQGDQG